MKTLICLIALVFAHSALAWELTPAAKDLVLSSIANAVYAEDASGNVRAPQAASDFQFVVESEDMLIVTGQSFSAMDNKVIGYLCQVELLGRDTIESEYDFELLNCQLSL